MEQPGGAAGVGGVRGGGKRAVRRKQFPAANLKRFYESPEVVAQFEPLREVLVKEGEDPAITAKQLAGLALDFVLFQDRALGVEADPTARRFTKLPAKLFLDFRGDGALCRFLHTAFLFKYGEDWRRFDFTSAAKKEKNVELIGFVESQLLKSNQLKRPTIFFSSQVPASQQAELGELAKRHGAKISTTAAKATHIVVPDPNPQDDEIDYLRTLERKDNKCLVHWWYYPDSYDNWIPSSEVEGEDTEPEEKHIGVWRVNTRWITDTDQFNEWMNEIDYEADQAEEETSVKDTESASGRSHPSTKRKGAKKRQNETKKAPAPAKKPKPAETQEEEPVDIMETEPTPTPEPAKPNGKRKERDEREEKEEATKKLKPTEEAQEKVEAVEASKQADQKELEAQAEKRETREKLKAAVQTRSANNATALNVQQAPSTPRGSQVRGTPPVQPSPTTPRTPGTPSSYGASLSSALASPKTPAVRRAPPARPVASRAGQPTISNITQHGLPEKSPLSVSIATPATGEPINVNIPTRASWFKFDEIHQLEKRAFPEFFVQGGPISNSKTPEIYKEYRNFMVQAYQQVPSQYLTQTACRRNLAGDVGTVLRIHSFLEHWGLINYNITPDVCIPRAPHRSQNGASSDQDTPLEKQIVNLQHESQESKSSANLSLRKNIFFGIPAPPQVQCFSCSSNCTKSHYHCEKDSRMNICTECFTQGNFPDIFSSGDFAKVDAPLEYDVGEWTDQETLLLLEGIERFNEDWDAVAEHVETKTKEECILQFLRLPIEDSYLEDQVTLSLKHQGVAPPREKIPFSQANNPIMAMVSFLASVVSPNIAAVAAQSALDAFLKQRKDEHAKKTAKKENGETDSASKTAEEMLAGGISREGIEIAATAALSAASLKAKALAERDEREIQNLVAKLIDTQLKKIELKMKHFNDVEQMMDRERMQIERARQQLYAEQLAFNNAKLGQAQASRIIPSPGGSSTKPAFS